MLARASAESPKLGSERAAVSLVRVRARVRVRVRVRANLALTLTLTQGSLTLNPNPNPNLGRKEPDMMRSDICSAERPPSGPWKAGPTRSAPGQGQGPGWG